MGFKHRGFLPVGSVVPWFKPLRSPGHYAPVLRMVSDGVYLMRDRRSHQLLYIGESHSKRLKGTLTRHFQSWSDKQNTAGVQFDPDAVDVAIVTTAPDDAVATQNRMIVAWEPEDSRQSALELADDIDSSIDIATYASMLFAALPF